MADAPVSAGRGGGSGTAIDTRDEDVGPRELRETATKDTAEQRTKLRYKYLMMNLSELES